MNIQIRCDRYTQPGRWYGLAWVDDFGHTYIFYPVPLNIVIRWGRDVWWWLRSWDGSRCWYREGDLDTHIQSRIQPRVDRAYRSGWASGRYDVLQKLSTMDIPTQDMIRQHLERALEGECEERNSGSV